MLVEVEDKPQPVLWKFWWLLTHGVVGLVDDGLQLEVLLTRLFSCCFCGQPLQAKFDHLFTLAPDDVYQLANVVMIFFGHATHSITDRMICCWPS